METNDLRMVEENFQFDIRASGILWNEETDDILLSRENDKQVIQVVAWRSGQTFGDKSTSRCSRNAGGNCL